MNSHLTAALAHARIAEMQRHAETRRRVGSRGSRRVAPPSA